MTKQKIFSFIKEAFLVLIVVTITANLMSLYRSQSVNNAPLTLKHLQLVNGEIVNTTDTKPVMLYFWATWCPVCKAESSNIALLSKHYNIITVAVNSGTDKELQKYLQEHKTAYRVVNDDEGTLAAHFQVPAYPTILIYDKKKNLVFKEIGYTSTIGLWLRLLWAEIK